MTSRILAAPLLTAVVLVAALHFAAAETQADGNGQPTDWNRFYYYPYVYYPHNFQRPQQSRDNMYHRYPPRMRIPVYNKGWYNFYPTEKPYHKGHHFILDVF